jgi:hypothetical protein
VVDAVIVEEGKEASVAVRRVNEQVGLLDNIRQMVGSFFDGGGNDLAPVVCACPQLLGERRYAITISCYETEAFAIEEPGNPLQQASRQVRDETEGVASREALQDTGKVVIWSKRKISVWVSIELSERNVAHGSLKRRAQLFGP